MTPFTMISCLLVSILDVATASTATAPATAFITRPTTALTTSSFQTPNCSRPHCLGLHTLSRQRHERESLSALSLFSSPSSSSSRGKLFGKGSRNRIFGSKTSKSNKLFVSSSDDSQSDVSNSPVITNINGDNELNQLKRENQLLNERLKLLQLRNEELLEQQKNLLAQKQLEEQNQKGDLSSTTKAYIEQRLILEDFEGEGLPQVDARGNLVDGWDRAKKKYTEPWDEDEDGEMERGAGVTTSLGGTIAEEDEEDDELGLATPTGGDAGEDEEDDELGLAPSSALATTSQQQTRQERDADDVICEYDEETQNWGECPVEPNISFKDAMKSRAYWLVGLLALQSCSGFILSRNEALLQDHPVIIYFLTMLVGAGGNAGNQASVRVIRGLALGTLNPQTQSQFLSRELRMAVSLSLILSMAGFLRATLFQTPFPETMAVTMALSLIVFSSICLGAVLPLLLQKLGVDPAHSSTTIQVVMDILGVVLTVFVSTAVLDSPWGKILVKGLSNWGI